MDDLVTRLRKRAEIRRQILDRKSVQEGRPDRIADLLEEAADHIERRASLSWVGLTDEDYNIKQVGEFDVVKFAKYIEAKLKEKNNA